VKIDSVHRDSVRIALGHAFEIDGGHGPLCCAALPWNAAVLPIRP
jgi:hypothetical protein